MTVNNPWGANDSKWFSDSELNRWTMALPPSVDQEIVTSVRFASLANAAEFLGSQSNG